jgi:hypothetical protein
VKTCPTFKKWGFWEGMVREVCLAASVWSHTSVWLGLGMSRLQGSQA